MAKLFLQVCLLHPAREAVARCPECRRCFCRECVVEHDDRLVCAACLRQLAQPKSAARLRLGGVLRVGAAAAGIVIAWVCFYWLGQMLLRTPSSFHEGTVWKKTFLDE
ncbi:MAG: rhomboid family protein [Verrucomicrobia bacterium]|nr:rhomboid family protein [Verrucomicrobiota bacterium]